MRSTLFGMWNNSITVMNIAVYQFGVSLTCSIIVTHHTKSSDHQGVSFVWSFSVLMTLKAPFAMHDKTKDFLYKLKSYVLYIHSPLQQHSLWEAKSNVFCPIQRWVVPCPRINFTTFMLSIGCLSISNQSFSLPFSLLGMFFVMSGGRRWPWAYGGLLGWA